MSPRIRRRVRAPARARCCHDSTISQDVVLGGPAAVVSYPITGLNLGVGYINLVACVGGTWNEITNLCVGGTPAIMASTNNTFPIALISSAPPPLPNAQVGIAVQVIGITVAGGGTIGVQVTHLTVRAAR
jgi:hypothetical protein